MVEFNLLPDIKIQYLKTKRLKRSIVSLSIILSVVFLVIFGFLFTLTNFIQKYQINNLNSKIIKYTHQISNNSNLNKVLTIQNQLNALPNIEAQAPATSRVFNFMSELTPANATISDLNINFTSSNITINGGADSLSTVNQFIDTLKYTTYKISSNNKSTAAFSSIILNSFSYTNSSGSSTSPATYSITLNFDPTIFNNTNSVTLTVPSQVTTRSILNQPTNLFQANSSNSKG